MNSFKDPRTEIDKAISKNTEQAEVAKSPEVQKAIENYKFRDEVQKNPIQKKYKVKTYGFETVDLNAYLNNRLWPRGIYTTDKLIRLGFSAQYEMLKKYLKKKRQVPFNMLWIIIIVFAVVIGLVVVLMVLGVL